jgi:hypothetical protein
MTRVLSSWRVEPASESRFIPSGYGPQQRSFHECGHAARGIQCGYALDRVTLSECAFHGSKFLADERVLVAGFVGEYMFGFLPTLCPPRLEYEIAINSLSWGEAGTQDLERLFALYLTAFPSARYEELFARADLAFARCHQALRDDSLMLSGIEKCAAMLLRSGRMPGTEFCRELMT